MPNQQNYQDFLSNQVFRSTQISHSYLDDQQFQNKFRIRQFCQKYIFKPFDYPSLLEQTLKFHLIKDESNVQLKRSKNQQYKQFNQQNFSANISNTESINSTSKSIRTNKTIFDNQIHQAPANIRQFTQIFNSKIALNKKNALQSEQQYLNTFSNDLPRKISKPAHQFSRTEYNNSIGTSKLRDSHSKNISQFKGQSLAQQNLLNTNYSGNNMSFCQSIAMGSIMVQNFIRSTSDGFYATKGNNSTIQSSGVEKYSFYTFCQLLFPEESKSVPSSMNIIDTLFYSTDKDIVYVFKDKKKGLVKIKNKNKMAYEIFLKRRSNYEMSRKKTCQQTLIKSFKFNIAKLRQKKSNDFTNFITQNQSQIFSESNQQIVDFPLKKQGKNAQIGLDNPNIELRSSKKQQDKNKDGGKFYLLQHQLFNSDLSKALFNDKAKAKPQNIEANRLNHSKHSNYVALLKYKDGNFIRLKQLQFKAIFLNPLYANQRFKNNNNTQYIQAIPIEDPHKDIKVYSIHYHYEIFAEEPLFQYIKQSLYKQNEFVRNSELDGSNSEAYCFRSPEKENNIALKDKLRKINPQIYLYFQIFEMYVYISMHYNKQLLNGVFKFVEYENDFALYDVQNIVINSLSHEDQFIKTKIFNQPNQWSKTQRQITQKTQSSNCTLTGQSIENSLVKNLCKKQQMPTVLQKSINLYFSQQNKKIESQMNNYLKDKMQAIENVKDGHLSKNIFRILNPDNKICQNFHELLNNDKKFEQFLKNKQKNNPYIRKNISNFSIIRSKINLSQGKSEQKQKVRLQRPMTGNSISKTNFSQNSCIELSKKSEEILLNKSSALLLKDKKGVQTTIHEKQEKLFKKKLINQKYNQFNKSKFILKAYRVDRFM